MSDLSSILTSIRARVTDRLSSTAVPQVSSMDAPLVANAAVEAAKPVIVNATNNEKPWQSRIYIGLAVAAIATAVNLIWGYQLDQTATTDLVLRIISLADEIFLVLGLIYAWYGRLVGTKKPPLGAR